MLEHNSVQERWDGVKDAHVEAVGDEEQDVARVGHQPLDAADVVVTALVIAWKTALTL